MGASKLVALFACAWVVGCGGARVEPGLASAPVLSGASPETRVHDVIANGQDACERSTFPEGEVLRGHVPPCPRGEAVTLAVSLREPPPARTWVPASYPLGVCPGRGPHLRERVAANSLTASSGLGCDAF